MPKCLTNNQVSQYKENGFVSPIHVLTREKVAARISDIDALEAETGKQIDFPYKSRSHKVFSWADRLVYHPKIVDAVEDIIGPDIIIMQHFESSLQDLILSYDGIKTERISF